MRRTSARSSAKLKATGAKLIFATTTPVPEGKMSVYRTDADAMKYNEAALKVMKENNIAVNDLYTFVKPKMAHTPDPARERPLHPCRFRSPRQGSRDRSVKAAVK